MNIDNHNCNIENCQFNSFLKIQKVALKYTVNQKNKDIYCIFHVPSELQEYLTIQDKKNLQEILEIYVEFCDLNNINIDFTNVVLHDFIFPTKNKIYKDIIFDKTHFIGYPNLDNLQCENLTINDCVFERGARFKNVSINSLRFKAKKIKEAIVFETGGYASCHDGVVQKRKNSYIKKVEEFTNHVEGDGKVIFVGAEFDEACFTNAILDNVAFQNCDLTNTYFLNSKVDKTEFRNCVFPRNIGRMYMNEIQGNQRKWHILLSTGSIGFLMWFITGVDIFGSGKGVGLLDLVFIILMVPMLWLLIGPLGSLVNLIIFGLNRIDFSKSETPTRLNSLVPGHHTCTADEFNLYKKLNQLPTLDIKSDEFRENKKNLQNSLRLLANLYQQLRKNFDESKEVQKGGDFFYTQRYTELLSGNKDFIEIELLRAHLGSNGFGERFLRPLIWLIFTVFTVAMITIPNEDYIATKATPEFLLKDYNISSKGQCKENPNQLCQNPYIIKSNNIKEIYIVSEDIKNNDKLFDKTYDENTSLNVLKLSDKSSSNVATYYALAGIVAFFTPESKKWFKNRTEYASRLQLVEGILTWFFLGAFLLAIRNRIRRQ